MHRSSPSISNLAAALAKAQIELVNPEKSLTGTIESAGSRGKERTFSYAPLSSGLAIVRKTLGHHEIATVQNHGRGSGYRHDQSDDASGACVRRMDRL